MNKTILLFTMLLFGVFLHSQVTFVSETVINDQQIKIVLNSPELSQTELHNSPEVTLYVVLPKDYHTSQKKYPVVYYLHGFSSMAAEIKNYANQFNNSFTAEKSFIVVGVDGRNKYYGSFFVNSPVSGNYEDWLTRDAVGYIESRFRTLNKPESRGLLGLSMGGFGVLHNSLAHPDIFKVAYAVAPGVFAPESGLQEAMISWDNNLSFKRAYGSAFAGNYIVFPVFNSSSEDNELIKKWEGGFGGWEKRVDSYLKKNVKLQALAIEWGASDGYKWIPSGSEWLAGYLTSKGVSVQIEKTTLGHDMYPQRMNSTIIPFFMKYLQFQ
ncbi:MAG: hypothetical protein A2015_06070 [Spirochaetes bacterium GWF1_31_7]|nr:MAG: hypothetical protein A2Y30_07640 [Spirochaetes bacterium GWE1_32_154]OHD50822.1 MAG: hypothetical protein A2Y29_02700 [Spirochaetes bacterium GWE2_31_10]OHD52759.1 MAG: hypothetical protein A2015_06070 [Spirochaetes bacterium GWF1_31_7]OHD81702.1 MAG: hypothetical protein A2355_07555 [Spirochaetes bacterium RIFOXYB1_FULL_32_8]HBD95436.1 hypothetical protein [Spirochaetia bacterium]